MASEHYSMKLEVFNITCHQLMLSTVMVVPVPVRPVNKTRHFLCEALILQVITSLTLHENRLCETVFSHIMPQMFYNVIPPLAPEGTLFHELQWQNMCDPALPSKMTMVLRFVVHIARES